MDAAQKRIDLTVYGATGFTGRQTARELWEACRRFGLTLSLAGRNRVKLEEIRSGLPAGAKGQIGIFVAESHDRAALDEVARRSRVVVNTAGPYSKYAPELLRACVDHGTDYVDITGESPFVRRMIDELHEKARARSVRIVPFCGYDSVPSDLGFWWVAREWKREKPEETLASVTGLFQARGGVNGGTIASALTMAATGEFKVIQEDLQLLTPKEAPPSPVLPDWRAPRRVPELGLWGAPFFMAPINTRVVRRSQGLATARPELAPSADYTQAVYEEGLGLTGAMEAFVVTAVEAAIEGLPRPRAVVNWLSRKLPQPGTGPDESSRQSGFTRVLYLGRGTSGSTWKGELFFKGDPGNRFTVRALCESALCLAIPSERARLPEAAGILTPAVAFGPVLLERLSANGVRVVASPN